MRSIANSGRRAGQTLIIALIVLGVLLVIGFVFLGIVNRNIVQTGTNRQRSIASDLAEAGIRYAHQQLLTGEKGADWRGEPTQPATDNDADKDLLGTRTAWNTTKVKGNDGFGPWTRVTFSGGRALVRVRYAPSDLSNFAQSGPAYKRTGKSRAYLMIESVGRPGAVSSTDPTVAGKVATNQKKLVAFCPIGITESPRFITNKDHVTRPADIGVPTNLGLSYSELADQSDKLAVDFPLVVGGLTPLYGFTSTPSLFAPQPFGGGIYSNADLRVHGTTSLYLCPDYGDLVAVAGTISAADDNSKLLLNVSRWNSGTSNFSSSVLQYDTATLSTTPIDSRNGKFTTSQGLVRDGMNTVDIDGFPRGTTRKEPPSIAQVDPATGVPRFLHLSRDSGSLLAAGNSGKFGHGRNLYVNNISDHQVRADEQGRINAGTSESLVYDWLNPNNGQVGTGWQGPFYVPRGAYLKLLTDGFSIYRDARAPVSERTWHRADGTDSGSSFLRFRLGLGTDGEVHILNALTPGFSGDINGTLAATIFDLGPVFDGVLYFEGNVRVRGQIPTDRQLTVVSNATIYIEGSITRGILDDAGNRLNRPSLSTLGLLAREYVCVNTTQFFGPGASSAPEAVSDNSRTTGYSPARIRQPDGALNLTSELLLDPTSGAANNPQSWKPYALSYVPSGAKAGHSSGYLGQLSMILTHAQDEGVAPATYLNLGINKGLSIYASLPGPWYSYLFTETADNFATSVYGPAYNTPGYTATQTGHVPEYGLGALAYQRYPKFETTTFDLAKGDTSAAYAAFPFVDGLDANGTYKLLAELGNDFLISLAGITPDGLNDYVIARAGLMPHDIRIEATIFAEEGSFFVLPGPWFNPNPQDNRSAYDGSAASDAERQSIRRDTFGNNPPAPFYAEPLDVRIQVIGAVSENMPPDIAVQGEWLKKWGWIPREIGASGKLIPGIHIPASADPAKPWVPNISISYDPVLATGRAGGFDNTNSAIRVDNYNRMLPALPRLPVSPVLAYFGESNL